MKATDAYIKAALIIILIIIYIVFIILFIQPWAKEQLLIESLSRSINGTIVYQLITLLLTLFILVVLMLLKKESVQKYFRLGKFNSQVEPVKIIGLNPKEGETWNQIGRNFVIIITLVTSIVMYFMVVQGRQLNTDNLPTILLLSGIFSLSNAFVEETIFRLGVITAFDNVLPNKQIALSSGAIFGLAHYFGMPGGIVGVLVAGFLGWFLAKSILETKGMFWAYFIHFLQDFVIFTSLFLFT